jgi:maltose O-acetyltransferase
VTTYPFRVAIAFVSSEIVPAFIRTKAMRALGFQISNEACIWAQGSFRSNKVSMAAGVFVNVGFYHDGYEKLDIGRNVRIGPFVRVITASHDIGPEDQRCLIDVVGGPVVIEDGCWIGAGVTIMPGVRIAKGCVIGANSLVFRSTRANGLYLGTPAQRVRDLNGDKMNDGLDILTNACAVS